MSSKGWTEDEISRLRSLGLLPTTQFKHTKWEFIAESFGRSVKACKSKLERIVKGKEAKSIPWTESERIRLEFAYHQLGNNWVKVAAHVRTKTARQCSNKWASILAKPATRRSYSEEEILFVQTHGWEKASVRYPDRPKRIWKKYATYLASLPINL